MMLELTPRDGQKNLLLMADAIESVRPLDSYGNCQIKMKSGEHHNVLETYPQVREMLGHPSPEDVKRVRLKLGVSMQSAVAVLKHCKRELRYYEETEDVGNDT